MVAVCRHWGAIYWHEEAATSRMSVAPADALRCIAMNWPEPPPAGGEAGGLGEAAGLVGEGEDVGEAGGGAGEEGEGTGEGGEGETGAGAGGLAGGEAGGGLGGGRAPAGAVAPRQPDSQGVSGPS